MAQVQTIEAESFLNRIAALPNIPGVSLDEALAPSIQDEAELRRLFAKDRQNDRLVNPYVGLVDVFAAPADIRAIWPRIVRDDGDKISKYVLPLADNARGKEGGPCMVNTLSEFQRNWSVFSEGALSQLTDWNNVVAAGGSVLACLLPVPELAKESKRSIRKYFHTSAYPTSDIDLFLWGLTPEQAEVKISAIYEAVCDSVPWDVTCVRTKHAISIYSQYPYRPVQIVLRLYHSPAEILAGFDVDSSCVMYDGRRALANPRAVVSMMRQCNTVDMTRRSPSYEIRLVKYASRGFEVSVPDLSRAEIDPSIFERSINKIEGLARLLVLEKLADPEARTSYLESRRALRSRPDGRSRRAMKRRRNYKGDLKAGAEIGGFEMNDYDVSTLHIPYGPGWNARRINKLIYLTDLGMNSTYNPKNKGRRLHRHPAFFGTMKECIEDCCEFCPEPHDDDGRALQQEEDKNFIRGRIAFMQDNPGRQSITGSFNPIDIGEWSSQAYIGPTEKFFSAIATLDCASVKKMISLGIDVNRRDHVGRTPLHLAMMVKATDISCELIDAGSRMTARLVDGRSCLHIAAQFDLPIVLQKLLERSAVNMEKTKEVENQNQNDLGGKGDPDEDIEDDEERLSDEDDWSCEDLESDHNKKKKKTADSQDPSAQEQPPADAADIPEDNIAQPDVLDVNAPDWDFSFTPLAYAIVAGSMRTVDILLSAGADPRIASQSGEHGDKAVSYPITQTILTSDENIASSIVERLLQAGASTSQANETLFSVLHALVYSGKKHLVLAALRADPNAKSALNIPAMDDSGTAVYPLVSAISKGDFALVVLLLAYGAKVVISPEDIDQMRQLIRSSSKGANRHFFNRSGNYLEEVYLPAECAIANQSEVVHLLVEVGTEISVPCKQAIARSDYDQFSRRSLLDCVKEAYDVTANDSAREQNSPVFTSSDKPKTWSEQRVAIQAKLESLRQQQEQAQAEQKRNQEKKEATARSHNYFADVVSLLEMHGAKSWDDLYPHMPGSKEPRSNLRLLGFSGRGIVDPPPYQRFLTGFGEEAVPPHLIDQYDALFEACWTGDSARIRELCLPIKSAKSVKPPIQIAVHAGLFPASDGRSHLFFNDGICTPLSVAILARRWDIARLVLAIATAQYKKSEDVTSPFTTKLTDIALSKLDFFGLRGQLTTRVLIAESESESDADSDNDAMDYEDDYKDGTSGEFQDVANRPSAVQCNIPPSKMLLYSCGARISRDGSKVINYGSLLDQAIEDGDFEAFVHLCDLMKMLPEPLEPPSSLIFNTMKVDSPEILDELIRRCGVGIPVDLEAQEESTEEKPHESKLYLGLSVHGVKRKDLVRRGGHYNPTEKIEEIPLLWEAARCGAAKIIAYLSSPAPLAAYRYYALTGFGDYSESLRRVTDFENKLPAFLGVQPNFRNETVVTAAILGSSKKSVLSTTKLLLSLYPAQSKSYLHSSIQVLGLSPLLLAVAQEAEPQYFDFLLANGVSVDAVDHRGWNLYHFVCANGSNDLLVYFFHKLPQENTLRLLIQGSHTRSNTPLMLAVKKGRLRTVELLLQANTKSVDAALLKRDSSGSMPVHVAVRYGFAKISSLLMSHGGIEAVHSENGVGETPLETAQTQWLLETARLNFKEKPFANYSIPIGRDSLARPVGQPCEAEKLAMQLKSLKAVTAEIEKQEKLWSNAKLKKALDSFTLFLEDRVKNAQTSPTARAQDSGVSDETVDRLRTYEIVSATVFASPGFRKLVRLSDVQQSALSSMKKSGVAINDTARLETGKIRDEELEGENGDAGEKLPWVGIMRHSRDRTLSDMD